MALLRQASRLIVLAGAYGAARFRLVSGIW
jgi:hypothetical protein